MEQRSGIMSEPQHAECHRMEDLPPEALQQVATYFQALSEPTRLRILNLLRDGERNVGDLALQCGFTAANVSRHLAMLTRHGLVVRETRGTSAYYRIADASVYALCDLVCGNIARKFERSALDSAAFAAPKRRVTARPRRS
jgi:DNA-binding transcriptional ArsR family regulator